MQRRESQGYRVRDGVWGSVDQGQWMEGALEPWDGDPLAHHPSPLHILDLQRLWIPVWPFSGFRWPGSHGVGPGRVEEKVAPALGVVDLFTTGTELTERIGTCLLWGRG